MTPAFSVLVVVLLASGISCQQQVIMTSQSISPKRYIPIFTGWMAAQAAEKEAKPIKAVAVLTGSGTVRGNVTFVQKGCGEPVLLTVYVTGLQPNGQFGFHVHEKGDLLQHCTSLGGHYNPEKVRDCSLKMRIRISSDAEPHRIYLSSLAR